MPLGELATSRRVVGKRQVLRKMQLGQVEKIFLAKDAAEKHVMELLAEAGKRGISVEWCETMEMLGRAGAITRKASVAGILKENLENIE